MINCLKNFQIKKKVSRIQHKLINQLKIEMTLTKYDIQAIIENKILY